jgi:tetratricopeptide (TPR) repeat protein
MNLKNRNILIVALLVLFIIQVGTQRHIDPLWKKNYMPKQIVTVGPSPEQVLLALGGLREFVAGILWVKADGFFHTGNYDALLPLVRIVTWLDPHQVDVYSTGAWHMAYNFTDEQQRSDRRYIAPALALLQEGVENNPNTYKLYFELGYTYSNKLEDHYGIAAKWFAKASEHPDILAALRNSLAHAYEKNGELEKCIDTWYQIVQFDEDEYKRDPKDWSNFVNIKTAENNLDLTILRTIARKYDTQPPLDIKFGAIVTVPQPKMLHIEGAFFLGSIGARVRCVLKDEGYELPDPTNEFTFDVAKDITYMRDSLYVRGYSFVHDIDMSKDPSMYSFKKDSYDLVFYWNPRNTSPHIQDRFGFNGEGLADKHYLADGFKVNKEQPTSPGAKWNVIYCKLNITKDQLLRKGKWADKIPVIKTVGYIKPPPRD